MMLLQQIAADEKALGNKLFAISDYQGIHSSSACLAYFIISNCRGDFLFIGGDVLEDRTLEIRTPTIKTL